MKSYGTEYPIVHFGTVVLSLITLLNTPRLLKGSRGKSRTKRKAVGSASFLQQQPTLACYQHYFNHKFKTQNHRGCGDERVNSIPARIITLSKGIGILSSLQYFEVPALKRNFCRKTAAVMCLISAVMTGDTSQNRIFYPVSVKCALVSFQPFRSSSGLDMGVGFMYLHVSPVLQWHWQNYSSSLIWLFLAKILFSFQETWHKRNVRISLRIVFQCDASYQIAAGVSETSPLSFASLFCVSLLTISF